MTRKSKLKFIYIFFSLFLTVSPATYATDFSDCSFWDEKCKINKIKAEREEKNASEQQRVEQYRRDKAEREAAREVETQEMAKQATENREAYENYQREEAARLQKERDDSYAKIKAEQEAKALEQAKERERQYQIEVKQEKAAIAKQQKATADKKILCGDDYQNPKIGMSIARVQQCVAKVKLISQINRADGVVSIYQHGNLTVHVMDNTVVSWIKL